MNWPCIGGAPVKSSSTSPVIIASSWVLGPMSLQVVGFIGKFTHIATNANSRLGALGPEDKMGRDGKVDQSLEPENVR